ncbi:hypothetical protein RM530_00325 [Algiphilus sp. W345]|uniref:Uncharacterized protein n=1 Tax=Banduia mediterranea TaxID=3075609 RepID=A0ABU2WD62_9GAMM|nr:hypothetical protein [Algiphilus sp. W345]MDT0495815.1 hypothetical protein [Algiphilus sp. W345]
MSHDRDYVVMLNDWTDEDPHSAFAKLKRMGDYYNYRQHTVVRPVGGHPPAANWTAAATPAPRWRRCRPSAAR